MAIEDAEIKLISTSSPHPVAESSSNDDGQYLFSAIASEEYLLIASKRGYLTSDPIRFLAGQGQLIRIDFQLRKSSQVGTISGIISNDFCPEPVVACVGLFKVKPDGETLVQIKTNLSGGFYLFTNVQPDFNLSADPLAALNSLYGLVLDQSTGTRIAGASVTLTDQQGVTVSTTTTNSDGQYLLCETANGSYLISAVKTGYELPAPIPVTVTGGQLARTNINLTPDVAVEATVQGFIRDENGNPLPGAFVGLYSADGVPETLEQTTFTNSSGFYLFGNLPGGNYVVKAKVEVTV